MRIESFPMCCSAKVLVGLNNMSTNSKAELLALLRTINNMKLIVATTVGRQASAEKALKAFGFKRSKSTFTNPLHWHNRDRVIIWYASVPDLIRSLS